MEVGDLVKLKKKINHATGIYEPGTMGIIIEVQEPTPKNPTACAEVRFERNVVTCYWRELENISANR